jgi:hypothetical protein
MDLQDEDIYEFAALWKEEFNDDLSVDEARHKASQFLALYALLAKPLPSETSRDDFQSL